MGRVDRANEMSQQARPGYRLRWLKLLLGLLGTGAVVYGGLQYVNTLVAGPSIPPPPPAVVQHHKSKPKVQKKKKSQVTVPSRTVSDVLPASYVMHVAAQSQLPALPNGCEVTSLSMLLGAVGHPISKMTLAAEAPRDTTPYVLKEQPGFKGNPLMEVTSWGNPNVGFVGSMSQKDGELGYGIYHGPVAELLNEVLPGQALDLTGASFSTILDYVAHGDPVEVWTTINFMPTNEWVTWQTPEGPFTATPMEHAVLVVGYTPTTLLVNNPYTGEAAQSVNRTDFIAAWKQLGEQAVTVSPSTPINTSHISFAP